MKRFFRLADGVLSIACELPLLVDASHPAPAALLVGEVREPSLDGRARDHFSCAYHRSAVLRTFGGLEWLLSMCTFDLCFTARRSSSIMAHA